jgi:hypothetical protein
MEHGKQLVVIIFQKNEMKRKEVIRKNGWLDLHHMALAQQLSTIDGDLYLLL